VARSFSKIEKLNVIREKLLNLLSHEKRARKMSMKLSHGVNILCAAFMLPVPKSTKETDNLTVFFALLGSVCVKASWKMLVKSTPKLNFINVLRTAFTRVHRPQKA